MPNPYPKPALSLTLDLLRVLSTHTWWNFGHDLKRKISGLMGAPARMMCPEVVPFLCPQHMPHKEFSPVVEAPVNPSNWGLGEAFHFGPLRSLGLAGHGIHFWIVPPPTTRPPHAQPTKGREREVERERLDKEEEERYRVGC